jgi:hypothetical protein
MTSQKFFDPFVACFFALAISILLIPGRARGQLKKYADHDTSYYFSYRQKLIVRAYLARKYTSIILRPPNENAAPVMTYRPNTSLNIGVGATYRAITLDIGIGLTSFNSANERGKTRYLDFQTHFYTRKWNVDLLGEFYRGYYLAPEGVGTSAGNVFYLRNDLGLQLAGASAYRALNDRRFSYQAALLQNEWQKKSAGSVLIGTQAFYGAILGDSALVPTIVDPIYAQLAISKVHFFEIGPGLGYAYCLVVQKYFFILASATVNLDFRFSSEIEPDHMANKLDFTPNFIFYGGIGYNTQTWDISAKWLANELYVKGAASGYRYSIAAGSYRLVFTKRFSLNRKERKALQPLNNLEINL